MPELTPIAEISVVAPLWNEKLNVLPLAAQVFAAFRNERRSLELILVDDASTDGTWEQILEAKRLDARARKTKLAAAQTAHGSGRAASSLLTNPS